MSYSPIADFLALARGTPGGEVIARMPGLDYITAALARMGQFTLFIGQTAPTSNQATTVWIKPSLPSWVAEGVVYLWNAGTVQYEPATPALWAKLLTPGGYLFQSVGGSSNVISVGVTVLAVQRVAPAATALVLPNLAAQWSSGRSLKIVDWSTGVTAHAITLSTADGSTIMQSPTFQLFSSAVQLAGVNLHPVPELNGWIVAP